MNRRSDEYRWKQVLVIAAVALAMTLIGAIAALWLMPEMIGFPLMVGPFAAALFGMCTWYASAWDPE